MAIKKKKGCCFSSIDAELHVKMLHYQHKDIIGDATTLTAGNNSRITATIHNAGRSIWIVFVGTMKLHLLGLFLYLAVHHLQVHN
jgi:hypothetical protein